MKGKARLARVVLAGFAAWSQLLVQATPAQSSGLLDQLFSPIRDVLDDLLEGTSAQLGLNLDIPLDVSVGGLVDDVVGVLTDTVGQVLQPDEPFTPVGPTAGIPVVSELQRLEVLDGVIEDVVHPHVVQPVAEGLVPVVGVAQPVLTPLGPTVNTGVDAVYDALAEVVSAVGLEAGTYEARITTEDGTITRRGVVDVPTALDINEDGLQDLELEVRVITARPSIRVARLPGAPGDLPIRVEAVIAPGGETDPSRLAVGFDALNDTLPDVFRATLTDDGSQSGQLGVELHAVTPGETVAVVASAFEQGPTGPIDPTEISIGFTPVPEDVTATISGALEGGDRAAVGLEMSQPSKVEAAIRRTSGTTVEELAAIIDQAPESLDIEVDGSGDGIDINYAASAPVDRIALRQSITQPDRLRSIELGVEGIDALTASVHVDPENAFEVQASDTIDALTLDAFDSAGLVGRANRLRVRIEGVPNDLTADLQDGAFGLDAGAGEIDLLEIQLTSGPDIFLPDDQDGLLMRDTPDEFVIATRITGLKSASVTLEPQPGASLTTTRERSFIVDVITGDTLITAFIDSLPTVLDVSATGSGLHWEANRVLHQLTATLQQGGRSADLSVTDLPSTVDLAFGDDVLSWIANGVTPLVQLELSDPNGVLGRATSVRAEIVDLPASLVGALADGGFELEASAPIGSIEILATSGPEISLPDGEEGIVVRNTPDDQVIVAFVTGVERVLLNQDPVTFELETDHARVFGIDILSESADGSSESLVATLDQMPESVSFSLQDDGAGTQSLVYTGSAVVDALLAELVRTDADANTTTATLAVDDLPTELTIDLGEDGFGYTANSGFPGLTLDVTDPSGLSGRATRLNVALTDLPPAATLSIVDGRPELNVPSGEIGLLEALLTSGPEVSLPTDVDGLYLRDEPSQFVVAVRITGLRGLSLDEGATAFSLRTTGGRIFDVDVLQATETGESTSLLARLDSLPSELSIGLGDLTEGLSLDYEASSVMDLLSAHLVSTSPSEPDTTADIELEDVPTEVDLGVDDAGSVTYAASGSLTRLSLILNDAAGVFGRASTLNLEALDLPTGLTAGIDNTTGGLALDTTGGAIGVVDALLTSGPAAGMPAGTDGVVLRDTPTQYVISLHLEELRRLAFTSQDGSAEVELGTDAGRPFLIDGLIEDADGSTLLEATIDALPSLLGLSLQDVPVVDGTDRVVGYEASGPVGQLLANLEITDIDGTTTFGLEANGLPNALTLAVRADGTVDYLADGTLGELLVNAHDDAGIFAGASDLEARLVSLPNHVSITLGEDGAIALDAHGDTLGLLEAKATSSPSVVIGINPGVDGIVLVDNPSEFGTFIRVTGLRQVTVVPGPISVGLETAGGRTFVISASLRTGGVLAGGMGDVDISAALGPLPQSVTLGFESGDLEQLSLDSSASIADVAFSLDQFPAGGGEPLTAAIVIEDSATSLDLGIATDGTVQYAATQVVPLVAIDAFDPNGLFDRADTLDLSLQDLPTQLDLSLSDDGAVVIDAHSGTLGLMEILITTGPDRRVPAGFDGIRLEDLTDLIVSARFTDLKFGEVAQVPQPNVKLDTLGGRPLSLLLLESLPGKVGRKGTGVAYTEATLQDLPATVDLELLEGAAGALNIDYEASGTANSLFFETNSGDKWVTQATIASPVPASFKACQTDNTGCLPVPNPPTVGPTVPGQPGSLGQSTANIGSFGFVASEHTTLNIWDCSRPLTATCNPAANLDNVTLATQVQNLRLKTLHFAGDIQQGTVQASGRLYFNTVAPPLAYTQANADTMQGTIRNRDGSTRLNFTFGANFEAWDRYRSFDRFPSIPPFLNQRIRATRGGVVCSPGTNLSVTVQIIFNLTFNANGLLC